jgi:hypothetical protein
MPKCYRLEDDSTKSEACINLKSRGHTKTTIFRIFKTINAPQRFVYRWCTDYRETDPKITGSKSKRRILLKTKHWAIYVSTYMGEREPRGVNVVTLDPPNGWHLDGIGDEIERKADYVLTKLGPRKTRLEIAFTGRYKTRVVPSTKQAAQESSGVWDKYVAALEKEYCRRRRWGVHKKKKRS